MTKPIIMISVLALVFFALAPDAFSEVDAKYKIQPTDVLKITVHEQPDLETKTRVTADGYISFPLVGKIKVVGLTVQEAEALIKELLEKDYLVTAEVLVFIEDYHPRQVSVMGEVNTPGKFDMPNEKDITVLEAIAMAGGFTKDADKNGTKVMRVENGEKKTINIRVNDITERGQKDKDMVLQAEDIVYVPESFF